MYCMYSFDIKENRKKESQENPMEVRTGSIPLATLAVIFAGLQVWWIGITIRNGRKAEKVVANRRAAKLLQKDPLKDQKERLEKLVKK